MDHYPTPTKADTPPQPITDNGEGTAKAAPSPEAIPSWAVSLIDRVQELETQVTKLQREVELCRSAACTPRGVNRELSRDGKGNRPLDSCPTAGDDVDSPSPLAVPSRILDSAPTAPSESDDITLINGESRSKFKSETKSSRPTAPDSGFEKRQLIEDYIHLNDLIVTNETAINDAREYVKMIKEVDEMQTAENQRQIMELVVEINKKKEQRSAALAALITRSWTGEEESQMLLLVIDSAALGSKSRVTHQELTAVLTKMMKKSKEMDDLEKQLRDQAQLVKTLPPSVTEAGKALRSKKIRELSCRLSEEENAKEELENDCQQMLRCFLQNDADVRALVKRPMV
ncbi:hypothetical protein PHYSODRAFT_342680 [Phytophthora sojae]|uniref:Uncharacterized protein n=1 Tax=Phytophthora sojae (strain P6497) TaxID=1094619 RepID=G5AHA7_PHYSP|nr:hypothetical protein PHYSODRAFT_342680 [Phytophthora sojae]EGZ05086.1 hypothetical protein PHYSODRAFT_342680 [Phytophthora sojae]|eukprot:XP_009539458.1 hypothetical protein PHYSODRAFT_342680 [Phytophthora sojae]